MKNNYPLAGAFLAICVVGLAYLTRAGVQASLEATAKKTVVNPMPNASAPAHSEGPVKKGAIKSQLRRAARLFAQNRGKEGLAVIEQLSSDHPNNVNVWLNLGIARLEVQGPNSAREALDRARTLAPLDWDVVAELANVALVEGQLEEAVRLANTIPVGKGRLADRLRRDPRWTGRIELLSVQALRTKHGLMNPMRAQAPVAEVDSTIDSGRKDPHQIPTATVSSGTSTAGPY